MGGKKKKNAGGRGGPSSRECGGRTGQTQDVRLDPKMAGRLKGQSGQEDGGQSSRQGRQDEREDRKRTAEGGFAQLAMASIEQKKNQRGAQKGGRSRDGPKADSRFTLTATGIGTGRGADVFGPMGGSLGIGHGKMFGGGAALEKNPPATALPSLLANPFPAVNNNINNINSQNLLLLKPQKDNTPEVEVKDKGKPSKYNNNDTPADTPADTPRTQSPCKQQRNHNTPEKKMIEEKKKEAETSTLTGTVETEQSVQSAESSNEGEDSNNCGLGYNHFYNYPCAEFAVFANKPCDAPASLNEIRAAIRYISFISNPRVRSLLDVDIIDFRKQLEDYWLMEDNIVKVLGKMGDRRKRLKVEVVELMHNIWRSMSNVVFIFICSKGFLADRMFNPREVIYYPTYEEIDVEQEMEALGQLLYELKDLPAMFKAYEEEAALMKKYMESCTDIIRHKIYLEMHERGEISLHELKEKGIVRVIDSVNERIKFGLPFSKDEVLELIRNEMAQTNGPKYLELLAKDRPELIGSAAQLQLFLPCVPRLSKSIDLYRTYVRDAIDLCLEKMSDEEIEAAFTQFFGTIQLSHSHDIEWFVPIDFYKFNSAEKLRVVLLHHCLLGKMDIAMCAVVQLLMGLFNGDIRLLTMHSPDTPPQDTLVHRQKSLVIKAVQSLPDFLKSMLRGEQTAPNGSDVSFGRYLTNFAANLPKDTFVTAMVRFCDYLFENSMSDFLSTSNCMSVLTKQFNEGANADKSKLGAMFIAILKEHTVRSHLYSPDSKFSLADAFVIALGKYTSPTATIVSNKYIFIKDMLVELNQVIVDMESEGLQTDYEQINRKIDELNLPWYVDYFFLAAYLPTTLKPQRLSIILEKVGLPSFPPSLPFIIHSPFCSTSRVWPTQAVRVCRICRAT
ncbi:hypothetical protein WR25_17826 isoform A [Diploscapter pachys]|uniref:Uncharacterized protein n=1 Tax=Diploscapter pachys TaxID=2018661 RepID=A0A2A2KYX0_9BILA|nr:hypothetical protein WR25_17826 isoform A [Diploscapter pachys]